MEWSLDFDAAIPVFRSGSIRIPAVVSPLSQSFHNSVTAVPCTADQDPYGRLPLCWIAPDQYDHSHVDHEMERIFGRRSRSFSILDITTCSPAWWDEAHENELVVWEDGTTRRALDHGCVKRQVPSLASDAWRSAMLQNIERLVRHVESSPCAGSVIGYVVGFGSRGTWTHFGTTEGFLFDYNPQAAARFQEWMRERYGSAGGELPSPEERAAVDPRGFRHPTRQRNVIDHGRFLADLTAETLRETAARVKKACAGRCLFGARFGSFLDALDSHNGLQHGGQLGLHRVLDDESVDFLIAPAAPDPIEAFSTAPEASVRLHGKTLFHELNPASMHDSREPLQKALDYALAQGLGLWMQNPHRGMDEIINNPEQYLNGAERGGSRIALVLDDESMLFVQRPPAHFKDLITAQCRELSKTGMPFDLILRRDLKPESPYQFLVFPNLFFADRAVRDRIHEVLRRTNATALWLIAPGFVDEEPLFENVERVTGIRVRKPDAPHTPMIRAGDGEGEVEYGTASMWAHTPVIDDPDCRILGHYKESALPGLGVKEQDGWRSIYSGAPAVSAALLRRFAEGRGL